LSLNTAVLELRDDKIPIIIARDCCRFKEHEEIRFRALVETPWCPRPPLIGPTYSTT
jgi:hypothetical protein